MNPSHIILPEKGKSSNVTTRKDMGIKKTRICVFWVLSTQTSDGIFMVTTKP